MVLSTISGSEHDGDQSLHSTFASRYVQTSLPRFRMPDNEISKEAAYQIISDELMLDGNPRLNLASFVTTWMEPECDKLILGSLNKNYIDMDEYPVTTELQDRCVNMIARLFNAPLRDGEQAIGAGTVGSSEAIMLAGLAFKRKWQNKRKAEGKPYDKPNIVTGANVQVCWEKFARYFEVDLKDVKLRDGYYVMDPEKAVEMVDENTICVCVIMGSTYNGEFEDVKRLNELLEAKNKETGWNTPIHVDAASGGFVAPFLYPKMEWDFRLSCVRSINVSGHKYGLVYAGIGWVIWKSKQDLPEELIFHVNYLGADQPTFTLNFSKGASQIIAQYYQFIRLGFEGYKSIMEICCSNAKILCDGIKATGRFNILSKEVGVPVVAFSLKDKSQHDEYEIADNLRRSHRNTSLQGPLSSSAADAASSGGSSGMITLLQTRHGLLPPRSSYRCSRNSPFITETLPPAFSLSDAREALVNAVTSLQSNPPAHNNGVIRFHVPLLTDIKALKWLQSHSLGLEETLHFYFSPRGHRGERSHEEDADILKSIAGIGSAALFKGHQALTRNDVTSMKRFLSSDCPLIRVYGAMRFNSEMEPFPEWRPFGTFLFFIPQVEFCECLSSCSLLAVTVAWDETLDWSFTKAVDVAMKTLSLLSDSVDMESRYPVLTTLKKEHVPSEEAWDLIMKEVLELLELNQGTPMLSQDHGGHILQLSKVVLARKTKLEVDAAIEPLSLIAVLQEKNPNAYQFCIQLPTGDAFIGSTPERLFYKSGLKVFSEAVAGTRACGISESNDYLASIDLLLSAKDHTEFDIVMEFIKRRLETVCKDVKVNSYKSLIKQANVQHLYGCLSGILSEGCEEFELLSIVHPTPAVCGHPQEAAKRILAKVENFDRGLYAGPLGWISGDKAEFAVAIRSALLEPSQVSASKREGYSTKLFLYSGVGIVKDATSAVEWKELDLKIQQFEAMLQPVQPLCDAVNINALWARLIVDELCRLGATYFCIAPGSRSSPLAVAAAATHWANCISCIDERSLAFHALGYGRGACRPAVVITSSGTAVSNLLPAVVEANQDCVPMILLTADRPPELQDTGANQTIDQVKHFGVFVRFNVSLPPPSDSVQARFVLTSIDSAVFHAMNIPAGPVHVNICFREPLAGTPENWNTKCLRGLDRWALQCTPFTKYIKSSPPISIRDPEALSGAMDEIITLIEGTTKGLLLVGGLHTVKEAHAVMSIAKHLQWPVVADALSGVRFRFSDGDSKSNLQLLEYFDHVLLESSVVSLMKPDTVVQIGGRLTSKRIMDFLEACCLSSYILVEEHPFRQDPCHILTHRVQCSVNDFAVTIISNCTPKWSEFREELEFLSDTVGQELKFQLDSEVQLTEPHVTQIIGRSLPLDSALFLGNSMALRDADMYMGGSIQRLKNSLASFNVHLDLLLRTAGNRGASGIDGILSTAAGFGAGSKQRITLLVGDISFLYDTNGLMFLKRRPAQPPIVVVVVNNSGGGIFSLLPVANTAPQATFRRLFTTPHEVSIQQLCLAHRVNHTRVNSKEQLVEVLDFAHNQNLDWVVEVESTVAENADFHRYIQTAARCAMNKALQVLHSNKRRINHWTIEDAVFFRYNSSLTSPATNVNGKSPSAENCREGFIFRIMLNNGIFGFGEVAPLQSLHKENVKDVEQQLRLLMKLLLKVKVKSTISLLNGCFSEWLTKSVGILPEALFPSVRCGLEMAVLGAVAVSQNCCLLELLLGGPQREELNLAQRDLGKVLISGLLDSAGTPAEMAIFAQELVKQGFSTLKIKVARQGSPGDDAAVLQAVRKAVGPNIHLRADANQRWTYSQAVEFATAVQDCKLQYLEEPCTNPDELLQFCNETGMPVALDETLDNIGKHEVKDLAAFSNPGIAAVVIKPSSVGGFERAILIAKWAQRHGKLTVVSAAFESSVSLAAYSQLAAFLDRCGRVFSMNYEFEKEKCQQSRIPAVAHGLGTFMWLKEDVTSHARFLVQSGAEGVEATIKDAAEVLHNLVLNEKTVNLNLATAIVRSDIYRISNSIAEYAIHVLDSGEILQGTQASPTIVFFHGFLGTSRDWLSIMNSLSVSHRCISIDLPGHGATSVFEKDATVNIVHFPAREPTSVLKQKSTGNITQANTCWSMQRVAEALSTLFTLLCKKRVILVGYSMGARLALYMAMRYNSQIAGAVIVSGSPGLEDPTLQRKRVAQDDALSESLRSNGLGQFIDFWYSKPLWKSLRRHPKFATIKESRLQHQDPSSLAKVLCGMSLGRQPSLWEDLVHPPVPLVLVAGMEDPNSLSIAHKMCAKVCDGWKAKKDIDKRKLKDACESSHTEDEAGFVDVLEIAGSGHAVHVENPLDLVKGIIDFAKRVVVES